MTNVAISVLKEKKSEFEKEIQENRLRIEYLEKGIQDINDHLDLAENEGKTTDDLNTPHKSSKTISQVLEEGNRSMNLTEITEQVVEVKMLDINRNAVGAALRRLEKKGRIKRHQTKPTTWSTP